MKIKTILLIALLALVLIQFLQIDKSNPSFDAKNDFLAIESPPAKMATMIKAACYDCHSYETKFPAYTYFNPVGFYVQGHIKNGREKLNFSDWGNYDGKKRSFKMSECAEVVEETRMPLTSYWVLHPEAKLSSDQRKELVDWFNSKQ